jgi:cell division protein FtsB
MVLRIVAALLIVALLALHYRLWISPNGMRDLWRTEAAIEAQSAENAELRERNRRLAAEVRDLKEGRAALEERARTDLGMVAPGETFFQAMPAAAAPPAVAAPVEEQQRPAEPAAQ